jgi:hypothetical protein
MPKKKEQYLSGDVVMPGKRPKSLEEPPLKLDLEPLPMPPGSKDDEGDDEKKKARRTPLKGR